MLITGLLLNCVSLTGLNYSCSRAESRIHINKTQIVFAETVRSFEATSNVAHEACRIMLNPKDLPAIYVVGSCENLLK